MIQAFQRFCAAVFIASFFSNALFAGTDLDCSTLLSDLRNQSSLLKETLKKASDIGLHESYDVVVVGAGLHASILNSNLKQLNPDLKILTVEAGDTVSNGFGRYGKFFRITSPELPNSSTNLFPGGKFQVSDFSNDEYPLAEVLGKVALANQYSSNVETLFNTRVTQIENRIVSYRLIFEDGIKVDARTVVVATGLGESSKPLHEKVITSDAAMIRAVQMREQNQDPLSFYKGKTVAILGAGQAGNYWAEFFLGKSPAEIYLNPVSENLPQNVFWFGQSAKNIEEFKRYNDRRFYRSLSEVFSNDLIKRFVPTVGAIRKTRDGSRLELLFQSGKKSSSVQVDEVIVATGYDNKFRELLGKGFSKDLIEVSKPAIAKQVLDTNAEPTNVYVVGPAARPLVAVEELSGSQTNNPVTLELLGKKTQRLAVWLESKVLSSPVEKRVQSIIDLLDKTAPGKTVVTPLQNGTGSIARYSEGKLIANLNYWLYSSDPTSIQDFEIKVWREGKGLYYLLFAEMIRQNPQVVHIESDLGGTNYCLFTKALKFKNELDALKALPAYRIRRALGFDQIENYRVDHAAQRIRWSVKK